MAGEKCGFRFGHIWAELGTKGHKKAELGSFGLNWSEFRVQPLRGALQPLACALAAMWRRVRSKLKGRNWELGDFACLSADRELGNWRNEYEILIRNKKLET
jgi:hypothetical protein